MTPASARILRRRKVAELRAAEPELSLRQMAERLDISRDTVTRDLEAIDRAAAESAPPADPADDTAPQVSGDSKADRTSLAGSSAAPVADGVGRSAETVSATLPRRLVADPLADIDVSQWRALRRDFAVLAQTGQQAEVLVHQAVVTMAHAYKKALARGDIAPGVPFLVRDMTLVPVTARAERTAPTAPGLPPGESA